jgi:sugar/nucleoside kinase (ribokinase family)
MQLDAAGSLANTLAGCALLGDAFRAHRSREQLQPARIAMAGPIGDDHLGDFFRRKFASTGVCWIQPPAVNTGTGTVIVLTTPDAQRSFLSYPGPPTPFHLSDDLLVAVGASRCLVIEGYLWELPNAAETIAQAISAARKCGNTIVMTTADVSVVSRFRDEMLATLRSVDILFTNAAEARELVGQGLECLSRWDSDSPADDGSLSTSAGMQDLLLAASACERWGDSSSNVSSDSCDDSEVDRFNASYRSLVASPGRHRSIMHDAGDAALQLGRLCSTAVVTNGSKGSCVAALGQLHLIQPHWTRHAPVDTCGAGDAYAAGFLYGYLSGLTIQEMGELASETASAVISHEGPQLRQQDAAWLAQKWGLRERTPVFNSIPDACDVTSLMSQDSQLCPSMQCF